MAASVFVFTLWGYYKIPQRHFHQNGRNCVITGRINTVSRKSIKLSVESVNGEKDDFAVCLFADRGFEDGQKITAYGSFAPLPFATNPHQFDYGRFLVENSISAIFYCDSVFVNSRSSFPIDLMRNWIREKITDEFAQDRDLMSLALTVTIGDRMEMTEDVREDFLRTGTSHVLAISGLHTGIFLSILLTTASALGVKRKISYIFAIFALIVFLKLTGGQPSVFRACVGSTVFLCGSLFERNRNPYQILGLAGLFILALNPLTLWNPGFQMSFSSVLGIIVFMPQVSRFLKKFSYPVKYIFMAALLVITINICLLPITSTTYGKFYLFSPLANLLIIPFLYLFITAMLLFLFFSAIPLFSAAVWFFGKSILFVSSLFAISSPGFRVPPYTFLETLFFVLCLALLKISLTRRVYLRYFLMLTALFLAFFFSRRIFFDKSYVLFFDVGQGNACLIHSRFGQNMLIDAGRSEVKARGIVNYSSLELLGSLDAVVATHQDLDHIGGMEIVVSSVDPDFVFFNGVLKTRDSLSSFMIASGDKLSILARGDSFSLGDFSFAVLSPDRKLLPEYSSSQNEHSIFLRAVCGKTLFVLPGDRPLMTIEKPDYYDKRILLISHHGDGRANPFGVIESIAPYFSVISVGENNTYGHPSESLLLFLSRSNIHTLRTDMDGAIKITLPEVSVKCYNGRSYLWHFSREEIFN